MDNPGDNPGDDPGFFPYMIAHFVLMPFLWNNQRDARNF